MELYTMDTSERIKTEIMETQYEELFANAISDCNPVKDEPLENVGIKEDYFNSGLKKCDPASLESIVVKEESCFVEQTNETTKPHPIAFVDTTSVPEYVVIESEERIRKSSTERVRKFRERQRQKRLQDRQHYENLQNIDVQIGKSSSEHIGEFRERQKQKRLQKLPKDSKTVAIKKDIKTRLSTERVLKSRKKQSQKVQKEIKATGGFNFEEANYTLEVNNMEVVLVEPAEIESVVVKEEPCFDEQEAIQQTKVELVEPHLQQVFHNEVSNTSITTATLNRFADNTEYYNPTTICFTSVPESYGLKKSKTAKLTVAERSRRYREKAKLDKERSEEYKRKQKERNTKRMKRGDMPKKVLQRIQAKERKYVRAKRESKKKVKLQTNDIASSKKPPAYSSSSPENISLASAEFPNNQTEVLLVRSTEFNKNISGESIPKIYINQLKTRNHELQLEIESLKNKLKISERAKQKYKKRWQRAKKQLQDNSFQEKSNS